MIDKNVTATGRGKTRKKTITTSSGGRIILPKTNGVWEDESRRGRCKWYPGVSKNGKPVRNPSKSNPEGLTWDQVKKKYNFESIEFKNDEPDFDHFSRGNVTFKRGQYTSNRDKNFSMADKMLAAELSKKKKKKITAEDVANWREEHGYTWHEKRDCRNLQKIPSIINNNIPHSGGIAAKKAKERVQSDNNMLV